MLTKIARTLRIGRSSAAKVNAASMAKPAGNVLTPAEADHWQQERQYWREQFKGWLQRHYGRPMHRLQDDDATVPAPHLVAQIQAQRKCCPDVYFATGLRTVLDFLRELDDHHFAPERFASILEFGVGLGRLIRHFMPLNAQLAGCDVTSEAIEFTRRALGDRVELAC